AGLIEEGTIEVGLIEVGLFEVGSIEVDAIEAGAIEVGADEVSANEAGAIFGSPKHGQAELDGLRRVRSAINLCCELNGAGYTQNVEFNHRVCPQGAGLDSGSAGGEVLPHVF